MSSLKCTVCAYHHRRRRRGRRMLPDPAARRIPLMNHSRTLPKEAGHAAHCQCSHSWILNRYGRRRCVAPSRDDGTLLASDDDTAWVFHKDSSLGEGSGMLNSFFVPSSPRFDVIADSGSAHVHAEQDGVVGWRGEDGLPSAILGPWDFVYWSTQPIRRTEDVGQISTQAPCTPALAHTSSLDSDLARNTRAPHFTPQHWLLCHMGLY